MTKTCHSMKYEAFRTVKLESKNRSRIVVTGLSIATLILSGCLGGSPVDGPGSVTAVTNSSNYANIQATNGIKSAIEAQKEAHPMILGRPGVIGIGASTDDDGAPVVVVFMTDSAQVGKLPRRV